MTKHITIEFDNNTLLPALYGEHNSNLKYLEAKLPLNVTDRGNTLTINGNEQDVRIAETVLSNLWAKLESGENIDKADIDSELRFFETEFKTKAETQNVYSDKKLIDTGKDITIKTRKKTIVPRSPNQAKYLQSITKDHMVFGLGPAGTGKTYLAVAKAVELYLNGHIERMIFCRPAVEAGENLGFLPGDMKDKVDPYLRPIYDALQDMLPLDFIAKKIEAGEIEIAPLAFMRGRTLSHAFVILDEAQNTTCTQMKMLLTRLGEASRMVVTGDLTQTDLPVGVKSGLRDALETLENVDGITFHHFSKHDVIRHPLVGRIIDAYDKKKGS